MNWPVLVIPPHTHIHFHTMASWKKQLKLFQDLERIYGCRHAQTRAKVVIKTYFDIDWLNQSISCFTRVCVAFASWILMVARTACRSKFPKSVRTMGSSTASVTRWDNRDLQSSKSLCGGMMFRLNTSTFATVPSVYPISRTLVARTFGKNLPQVSLRVKDAIEFSSNLLIAAVAEIYFEYKE